MVYFRKRVNADVLNENNLEFLEQEAQKIEIPWRMDGRGLRSTIWQADDTGVSANPGAVWTVGVHVWKTHSVENRIVSILQPYIRPIVRGKAKNPVEFGTKLDISIDEKGYARREWAAFDAYNEGLYLQEAVERYKERTGHYPERVLADTIYRNRENRRYCKAHGIRLFGPKFGRPCKATKAADRILEYQDNTDRIEVERVLSLAKRCYGLDLIRCKLPETTMTIISWSIFAINLFKALKGILRNFWKPLDFGFY